VYFFTYKRSLQFSYTIALLPAPPLDEKINFANFLNERCRFGRFVVVDEENMSVVLAQSTHFGIFPQQIIQMARLFSMRVTEAELLCREVGRIA
jgi:hypothetical protein